MSGGVPGSSDGPVTGPEVMAFGAEPREPRHLRRLGMAAVFLTAVVASLAVAAPAAAPAPEPAAPGITLTQWAETPHERCHGGELASRHSELRY